MGNYAKEKKRTFYLHLIAYDENGEMTDNKNIFCQDGIIKMENAIGKPRPERQT